MFDWRFITIGWLRAIAVLPLASQEISIAVWVVVQLHVFKWTEALYFMDGRLFGDLRYVIFHLLKHNKTDGFTVLCVSVLFNFDISLRCESFFLVSCKLGDVYCSDQHL